MPGPFFLSATIGPGVAIGPGAAIGSHQAPCVPWWSFTKTVMATAALLLVSQSRLALDRPLPGAGFTLRQLLQHRSGLPDYGGIPAYQRAARRGAAPWSIAELLRQADAARLLSAPGQAFAYSNIGYLRVRQCIEQATGQDFGAALDTLIFRPQALASVRLAATPEDLQATAWGNAAEYHPGWVYHGLLTGTPADAARFLHLLLTTDLLPAELRGDMLTPLPVDAVTPDRPWTETGYGMGLMIGRTSAGLAIGHTGAGPGSSSAIYHFPDATPRTIAVFAPAEDQEIAEFEAVRLQANAPG